MFDNATFEMTGRHVKRLTTTDLQPEFVMCALPRHSYVWSVYVIFIVLYRFGHTFA